MWKVVSALPDEVTGRDVFGMLELLDLVNLSTALCSEKARQQLMMISSFVQSLDLTEYDNESIIALKWALKYGFNVQCVCIADYKPEHLSIVQSHCHHIKEIELFFSCQSDLELYQSVRHSLPTLTSKVTRLTTYLEDEEEDYLTSHWQEVAAIKRFISFGDYVTEKWLVDLIQRNPEIETLRIEHKRDPYSEKLFTAIAGLGTMLTHLHLCTAMDDAHLAILAAACANLRTLAICERFVFMSSRRRVPSRVMTDTGLAVLAQACPLLHTLRLHCSRASDQALVAFVRHCPHLTSVNCETRTFGVTEAVLHALDASQVKLISLTTDWAVALPPAPITYVTTVFRALERVELTDEGDHHSETLAQALGQMHALRELSLICGRTGILQGLTALARACKWLKTVKLHGKGATSTVIVVDTALSALVRANPSLRMVELQGSVRTSNQTVLALAKHCPLLTTLRFCTATTATAASSNSNNTFSTNKSNDYDVTNEVVIALANGCPRLRILTGVCSALLGEDASLALATGCPQLRTMELD